MYDQLITIFGGSGFLGRLVVQKLARLGARLNVVVQDATQAKFLKVPGEVGQISLVPFPPNAEAYKRLLQGSSAVINLVGIIHESRQRRFDDTHVGIPQDIALAAAALGIPQLVHVSAIGADSRAQSFYAKTKAQGEAAVLKAFADATIVRPNIMFGPQDQFVNRFATLARLSPFLVVFGGGKTKLQPVYVGDVADAIVQIIQHPERHRHQIYELGGPEVLSLRVVLERMLALLKQERCIVSLPFEVGMILAAFTELLPNPVLTRDQLRMLRQDTVVSAGTKGFQQLGITPRYLEEILPAYLKQYKPAF